MKKIGKLKFYTFDEVFGETLKKPENRRLYEEELARLELVGEIRRTRIKEGLTQKEVAEKAGLTQSVIARIESGRRSFSLSTLYRLAKAFDKTVKLA